MEKYLNVLKKCALFSDIDDESLIRMLTCLGAQVRFYGKKHTVIEEGAPAKNIGIVLSGEVQLIRMDYYGNRSILAHIEPSHVFAEDFACAESSAIPISAVASEASDVMFIDCAHILHTCNNNCGFHRQLIYNLMKNLATKALTFHSKIEVVSKRTTREKLMTYLTFRAKKAGKNEFEIPFDRQELADYLEVERSGLSAEISKMRAEGIIECDKNRFKILNI